MKIAVAVKEHKDSSFLEYHFGKAAWFAIADENGSVEFLENKFSQESAAKGIMTANQLAEKGVKEVHAGEFGVKVKPTLDVLGIRMKKINKTDYDLKTYLSKQFKTT